MSNAATKYELVWGYASNSSMLVHEKFEGPEGRKACMARVKALFDIRHNSFHRNPKGDSRLAVLEVYATPPGALTTKTSFWAHVDDSPTAQHTDSHGGKWCHYSATLSGVSCG